MKKGKLVLANFDARISKIDIRPKGRHTKVVISSKMCDALTDKKKVIKIIFEEVAAIDFRINYFDNCVGSEGTGLYQIMDGQFIDKLVKDIFVRRKELYLLEGDYNYDENDPDDMLNVLDLDGSFSKEADNYHAYVQNVDAGVYIIVAKNIQII